MMVNQIYLFQFTLKKIKNLNSLSNLYNKDQI